MSTSEGRVEHYGGRAVRVGLRDGDGSTVVLLSGCGVPHSWWTPVLERLPGRRTLWLDRPGIGTPWPGRVPTLTDEVAVLDDLCDRYAPVVLVAHSMAAFAAEAVTRTRPGAVSGVVLVDGSVEWRPRRPASVARAETRRWERLARAARGVASAGRIRAAARGILARWLIVEGPRWGLTGLDLTELADQLTDPDLVAMAIAEFGGYSGQADELVEVRALRPWPLVPAVALTADRGERPTWAQDQRRLARLLGAEQIIVDSGHNIMLERPEAVVAAIERLAR